MNSQPETRRFRRLLPLAVAAAVGVGAGAAAYALSSNNNNPSQASGPTVTVPSQPASSTSSVDSLTQLYQADAPGIVDINVTIPASGSSGSGGFPFSSPSQGTTKAEGTGFEFDNKGDILTAEHVIDGASSIKVTFENGNTVSATLVGAAKSADTAVIHVNVPASQLHPLTLGDSSTAQVGQEVVAIGSPFGLPESMTQGIVSATNRSISAQTGFEIPGAIQTDAAINHGNSGGPLIDVATNSVIGIVDQIESDTNDNSGVGFAVPMNAAKSAAQTLMAGGTVQRAYMGVAIEDATGGGAKITKVVAGTPSAKAGLKVGDVITAIDGTQIKNADALTAAVFNAKPGQKATLTITRNGSTQQITITYGTQPSKAF